VFSFESTVESHGWYHLAPFRWSKTEGVLRRAEKLGNRVIELAVAQRGDAIVVDCDRVLTASEQSLLEARIARMLQRHVDLASFHEAARHVDTHRWVVDAAFGRLLCGTTLFEDAVKIIATTNTTWRQTVRMVALLVEKCGRRSKSGNADFPSPVDVARFSIEELQEECRLGYRAKTMHALASGIVDGSIDLALVSDPGQTTEELFASYRELPGIGPYGAAHLLAMDGRHDFIAVDSEFRRFVRERYHGGRKVADATMLRRYAKWGRWKYMAYWSELWSSVADALQPAEERDN
jgi:3-methyladenine DNA glycosylase/8-oxoguanine DNA glycosylase